MGAVVIVVKQGFDMEKIEAAILRSITKLHHCMNLIRPLQDEANRHRATLRNLHAAIIATLIGNANRGKGARPLEIDDFMIMSEKQRKSNETQQFIAGLQSLAKQKKDK